MTTEPPICWGPAAPAREIVVGRVQAYTAGYAHRIWHSDWSGLELGGQATIYGTPARLIPFHGTYPAGVAAILHWQIGITR